jgi:arsenate reductase-like glutaredoxin family protein
MSLNVYETQEVAKLFLKHHNWDEVRKIIIDENYLQKSAMSTLKRQFIEIRKRINSLNQEELEYLVQNDYEAKYVVMLSAFKTYKMIYDFAVEVMREKYFKGDLKILESDFENFIESKKLAYENLNTVTDSTKYKLRQVMFKMFEEAELITSTKEKIIKKPLLSRNLCKIIKNDDENYLKTFLLSKDEIERI